jgi:hypothetical protein
MKEIPIFIILISFMNEFVASLMKEIKILIFSDNWNRSHFIRIWKKSIQL